MSTTARSEKSLAAWLSWMESLHPSEIDLGLTRIRAVAERMNLLTFDAKIITVAGTNGKGSFVCSLAALLRAQGSSLGCYTSPHLEIYNERISINGSLVTDDVLCAAFSAINDARGSTSLTYFEFGTLAALYCFKQANVDFILLEVGLGGRLDAVNILDANLAVLTSVGLDHEVWLGSDRESVGREKVGILRERQPFICVEQDVPNTVKHHAEQLACHSVYAGKDISFAYQDDGLRLELTGGLSLFIKKASLPAPSLLAAAQAYKLLDGHLSGEAIEQCLSGLSLAGRYESIVWRGQHYIFDVAHNPQAAELLAQKLQREQCRDLTIVFTVMSDKDLNGIVTPLIPYCQQWVCTEIDALARCSSAVTLCEKLSAMGLNAVAIPHTEQAITFAHDKHKAEPAKPILVVGSFFIVGAVKTLMKQDQTGN